MAAPQVFSIAQVPLTAHSFSADRSHVAVSLNSQDAVIYGSQGNEWKPEETLAEHDKLITSIDWAPNTNRIVTCAQDRNAYVWQQVQDANTGKMVWKPTLVLLRINRAATFVRWSPKEDKFAVASGDRAIAVCSFDAENDWWVSKLLKKPIRSTVLSVDWHPNNVLLAAGSADMKARVFSAYIKDVDKRPSASVWGEKLPFNTVCGEYTSASGGWVHAVSFSPSGDALAFASHDSSITVVYPGASAILHVRTPSLPYVTLTWTTEDALIAAGHDCQPMLFQGNQSGWKAIGSLDDASQSSGSRTPLTPTATGSSAGGAARMGIGRLNNEAFNRFKNADSRGTSAAAGIPTSPGGTGGGGGGGGNGSGGGELFTVHQNTITSVRPYGYGSQGEVTSVSTSGVDGRLVIWNVSAHAAMGALAGKLGGTHLR